MNIFTKKAKRLIEENSYAEAEDILSSHGVPCARYRDMEEVLADPQLASRQALTRIHDGAGGYMVSNPPFRMSGSRAEARDHVPILGEDGAALLSEELGLTDAVIAALREARELV